jgi:hypothetical protein
LIKLGASPVRLLCGGSGQGRTQHRSWVYTCNTR